MKLAGLCSKRHAVIFLDCCDLSQLSFAAQPLCTLKGLQDLKVTASPIGKRRQVGALQTAALGISS
jgi:hypothetical protein